MNLKDLKIIESLTEDEKKAVEAIVKEISNNGKSDDLTSLYYEDYEEIPVDLETFLCSDTYLGNYTNHGKDIYETWKKELSYIHNPATFCDQWAITGCLDGSTKIPLLNGTIPTIYELYQKYKDNPRNNGKDTIDYLYSYDVNTNNFVVGELTRVFFTGVKAVYKLTLDNNKTVICTADHPFMTQNKNWKTLNTGLGIGYSLKPFNRESSDGYEIIRQQENGHIKKQFTHRMVIEYKTGIDQFNKEYEGHHKDFNPSNNHPSNLVLLTKAQHKSYHAKQNWKNSDYAEKAIAGLRTSNQNSELQRKKALNHWSKFKTKEERKNYLKSIGCFGFDENFNKFNHPNLLKIDEAEFIAYAKTCYCKWQLIDYFGISKGGVESYCKRKNINLKNLLKPIKYKLPQNTYTRRLSEFLNKLNSLYITNNCSLDFINTYKTTLSNWEQKLIKQWQQDGSLEDLIKYYNHKIVKIEYIGKQPTYDLTVRTYHNFCLDCGLVSKNSTGTGKSTVATYSLAYELYKLMCLKNPNRFYLNANETIWILFFNLNLKLAEKTMWRQISKSFTNVTLVYGKRHSNRKNKFSISAKERYKVRYRFYRRTCFICCSYVLFRR